MAQKYCLKKISKNEYENLTYAVTGNKMLVSVHDVKMLYFNFNNCIVFEKTTNEDGVSYDVFFVLSFEDGDGYLNIISDEDFKSFYRRLQRSKYIYKRESMDNEKGKIQKNNLGLHYCRIFRYDMYVMEIDGVFYELDFNEYENPVKEKVVLVEPQPFTETKSIPNDRKPIPVTTHSITTSVSTHKNTPTFLNDFDGLKEVLKIFKKISPEDREKIFFLAAELLNIPIALSCKNIDQKQIQK